MRTQSTISQKLKIAKTKLKNKLHAQPNIKHDIAREKKNNHLQNFSITWKLPYIYPRKHKKIIIPTETYKISNSYNKTHNNLQLIYKIMININLIWDTTYFRICSRNARGWHFYPVNQLVLWYYWLVFLKLVFIQLW